MIQVVARIPLKPGCLAGWLAAFNANRPKVLAEDGCHKYDAYTPVDPGLPGVPPPSPDAVVILETWASPAALRAHLAQPHMATYRDAVADLVAGPTEVNVYGDPSA